MRAAVVSTMLFGAASAGTSLPLVTFDGKSGTTFKFKELNDPVMGGKSTGNWSVQSADGKSFGVMDGVVVNVPSLSAPGFIKSSGDGKFADVSAALSGGLKLMVRSPTPEYTGFHLSFAAGTISPDYSCAGGGSIPLSRGCFKRKFTVKGGSEFSEVYLPFNTFSDKWSPATGAQTTTCADDADVCPTTKSLAGIKRIEFWAEGANGHAKLEVLSVVAVDGATGVSAARESSNEPPKQFNTCSQPIQDNLRFGISGRNTSAGTLLPVDENETLAAAVCCDSRLLPYAEPQFLYEAPDILLMSKLDKNGVTTWYDSSCGIPLFKSPVGRNFSAFEEDTKEHGWPSFRSAEVITENVMTNKTSGYVTSKCGTHLGSYLPDAQGPRWCIDLSCVSGNKQSAVKSTAATVLPLVTFDGASGTTFDFKQLNDPVMGGKSSGNWSLKAGEGVMQGTVVNVPSLSAPGFIKAAGDGKYNDVSAALEGGLRLTVRSPSSSYTGFRLSFAAGTLSPDYSCAGGGSIPLSRGCFKRQFAVKAGSEFSQVYLPFNTFSDMWSPATGKQTTTCADDKSVCPTAKDLAGIKRIEFWAEGVDGAVELDVKSVEAVYGA